MSCFVRNSSVITQGASISTSSTHLWGGWAQAGRTEQEGKREGRRGVVAACRCSGVFLCALLVASPSDPCCWGGSSAAAVPARGCCCALCMPPPRARRHTRQPPLLLRQIHTHALAVPHGLVSLLLCHHCLALVAVCHSVTADAHDQVAVGDPAVAHGQHTCHWQAPGHRQATASCLFLVGVSPDQIQHTWHAAGGAGVRARTQGGPAPPL